MSKQKKKRNKAYTGNDAVNARPIVTRVQAVNRGKVGQWWYDNKRIARPLIIAAGVLLLIIVLIIGIVGLFIGR